MFRQPLACSLPNASIQQVSHVAGQGLQHLRHLRAAFVIAAIVTPPDVVSQLALAIPMCLLYEVGIWAAQIFIKHTKAPEDDAAEAAKS